MKLKQAQDFTNEERRHYIGGSEIAILMGYTNYKTVYELWQEKTGRKISVVNSKKAEMGKLIEDFIAGLYEHSQNSKVMVNKKTYRHPKYPFCACHIDRLIVGTDMILECKNTTSLTSKDWKDGKIPEAYIAQVNWQLGLTARSKAIISVLIDGWDDRYEPVLFDEKLFEYQLKLAIEFWHYVETDTEPPKVARDYANDKDNGNYIELIEQGDEESLEALLDFNTAVEFYLQLTSDESLIKKQKKELADTLKEIVKENKGVISEQYIVSYPQKISEKFDEKLFAEKHPKLYKKFLAPNATRTMSVNKNADYQITGTEKAEYKKVTYEYLHSRTSKKYGKSKWIVFSETLLNLGYDLTLYEAKETLSKYIYVSMDDKAFKVRFSDHKPSRKQELDNDSDFYVGISNFGVQTTNNALTAVEEYFNKGVTYGS